MRGATGDVYGHIISKPFQSTRPMRGATTGNAAAVAGQKFQSTRPMRGATSSRSNVCNCTGVSIHAPHAGRDGGEPCRRLDLDVSIHAPHAGRDGKELERVTFL